MNALEQLFAEKRTENGDKSYNTTGNNLLDILFMTAYFEKHLDEVHIGTSEKEKLFSMFIYLYSMIVNQDYFWIVLRNFTAAIG